MKPMDTENKSIEEVEQLFRNLDCPVMTTSDVSEAFGISQQAAHKRLSKLHQMEKIKRKTVGANAVVWWFNRD